MPKHVKRRMLLSILAALLLSLLALTSQSIAAPSTQNETTQSESAEQPPAVVNCFGDPMFDQNGEPIQYNYN